MATKIRATIRFDLTIVAERTFTFELSPHGDPENMAYSQAWELNKQGLLASIENIKVKGASVVEVKQLPDIWKITSLYRTDGQGELVQIQTFPC